MTTNKKLLVEVVDARNLLPKDGHGTSSPYVVINFHGQKKRTQTSIRDLTPSWNQTLEFNVATSSDIFGDILELDLYHDKICGPTRRNNFLGRVRLSSGQFVKKGEEALIYYPLEKKNLFSWIQGEIGLKIYYVDDVPPPPPPPPPPAPPTPALVVEEVKKEEEKSDPPPPSPPSVTEAEAKAVEAAKPPTTEQPDSLSKTDAEPDAAAKADASTSPGTAPESEILPEVETTTQAEKEPPLPELVEERVARVAPVNMVANIGPQPIQSHLTRTRFEAEEQEISPIELSSYDLVQKMHHLFVRIVKARYLPTNRSPIVKIGVSKYQICSNPAVKTTYFEWEQTFAFCRDRADSSSILEISVWDPLSTNFDHISDVTTKK